MNDSRLVYASETGRICPACGQPAAAGACKKKKAVCAGKRPTGYSNDGTIRIQRQVKGRRGKTVTAVYGVPLESEGLQAFVKTLKRRCGAGGSVKDGVILIRGDHRQTLLDEIKKHAYIVKLAGGWTGPLLFCAWAFRGLAARDCLWNKSAPLRSAPVTCRFATGGAAGGTALSF